MNKSEVNDSIDLPSMERKFLKVYKELSHLWNPTHPDYNNRHKRNAGYDALLPIFRTYMPKATRVHVRQKINILRSCYRKELRKYLASASFTADGKVNYSHIPTNWKFPLLRFLDCYDNFENNVDDSITVETTYPEYEVTDEQNNDELGLVDNESGQDEPDTSKIYASPLDVEEDKPRTQKKSVNMTRCGASEIDVLERELNAVGANVACKLQRMKPQQRYHAELLINKVLIKGLKEQLTEEIDFTDSWHVEQVSVNYSERKDEPKMEATDEQLET